MKHRILWIFKLKIHKIRWVHGLQSEVTRSDRGSKDMKMFHRWSMIKHLVLMGVLLAASFFLRYFLMCYSGIDPLNIWIRVAGSEFLFPRYVLVFGIVNLLIPSMLVLFFRVLDMEAAFGEYTIGASSCVALASFYWHVVYMYPGMDESVAFFAALTIVLTILCSYHMSMKRNKGQKFIIIVLFTNLFLLVPARYMFQSLGEYEANRMEWKVLLLTAFCVVMAWVLWNRCKRFTRRVFALPAVLMTTFRWGYMLLMSYGMSPTTECFVGVPFQGRYAGYDVLCVAVLLICVCKRVENGPMLLIRVPGTKVKMAIEMAVLDKFQCLNRIILGTAIEVDKEVFGWKNLVKNTFIASEEEEEVIVVHVKEDGEHLFLIGETEEEMGEAKKWLENFIGRDNLTYTKYFMPKDFMYSEE